MFKTFAQRLTPPYSGLVQIAESDTYRALTLDGLMWEVQYVNRIHIRVCTMSANELKSRTSKSAKVVDDVADPALGEFFDFLADVELPFPATDQLEYWLLDHTDQTPLALIYSCTTKAQMEKFPSRAEWASLPDAVMKVVKTDDEIKSNKPPINYQLESLVSERAGTNKKAQWFDRSQPDTQHFPPLLVREDWVSDEHRAICKRYIDRQAPRLLMLQGISDEERSRLEACCSEHALEVARFSKMYPSIIDKPSIDALRVEARLREAAIG